MPTPITFSKVLQGIIDEIETKQRENLDSATKQDLAKHLASLKTLKKEYEGLGALKVAGLAATLAPRFKTIIGFRKNFDEFKSQSENKSKSDIEKIDGFMTSAKRRQYAEGMPPLVKTIYALHGEESIVLGRLAAPTIKSEGDKIFYECYGKKLGEAFDKGKFTIEKDAHYSFLEKAEGYFKPQNIKQFASDVETRINAFNEANKEAKIAIPQRKHEYSGQNVSKDNGDVEAFQSEISNLAAVLPQSLQVKVESQGWFEFGTKKEKQHIEAANIYFSDAEEARKYIEKPIQMGVFKASSWQTYISSENISKKLIELKQRLKVDQEKLQDLLSRLEKIRSGAEVFSNHALRVEAIKAIEDEVKSRVSAIHYNLQELSEISEIVKQKLISSTPIFKINENKKPLVSAALFGETGAEGETSNPTKFLDNLNQLVYSTIPTVQKTLEEMKNPMLSVYKLGESIFQDYDKTHAKKQIGPLFKYTKSKSTRTPQMSLIEGCIAGLKTAKDPKNSEVDMSDEDKMKIVKGLMLFIKHEIRSENNHLESRLEKIVDNALSDEHVISVTLKGADNAKYADCVKAFKEYANGPGKNSLKEAEKIVSNLGKLPESDDWLKKPKKSFFHRKKNSF